MTPRFALEIARALCVALCAGLFGCGGGSSAASEPATAHSKKSSSAIPESANASADEEEEDDAPVASTPCADGTCAVCGKGICPVGFYCDESAKGGAACSWLPQCGEKASCSCITKSVGAGCKCQDQGGSPHLTCND